MKLNLIYFLNLFLIVNGFINKNVDFRFITKNLMENSNKNIMSNKDLINYLISFKDYTIISKGENYKILENLLIENDMKVYCVNIDNLMEKDEILSYIKNKYKNCASGDNLWVFYKGFFIGSNEEILEIIENKKNKRAI